MGLKSTGSIPVFPTNVYYSSNSLVSNRINLALSKNSHRNKVIYTRKTFNFLQSIAALGVLNGVFITKERGYSYIKFSVFFYKNTSFFHKVKHVSTSSKRFFMTYKALKTLTTSLKASTIILSTSKGLVTHRQAMNLKIGGLVIFIIS